VTCHRQSHSRKEIWKENRCIPVLPKHKTLKSLQRKRTASFPHNKKKKKRDLLKTTLILVRCLLRRRVRIPHGGAKKDSLHCLKGKKKTLIAKYLLSFRGTRRVAAVSQSTNKDDDWRPSFTRPGSPGHS